MADDDEEGAVTGAAAAGFDESGGRRPAGTESKADETAVEAAVGEGRGGRGVVGGAGWVRVPRGVRGEGTGG
jgi:hypothetical protein